jgi:hypothetical protein
MPSASCNGTSVESKAQDWAPPAVDKALHHCTRDERKKGSTSQPSPVEVGCHKGKLQTHTRDTNNWGSLPTAPRKHAHVIGRFTWSQQQIDALFIGQSRLRIERIVSCLLCFDVPPHSESAACRWLRALNTRAAVLLWTHLLFDEFTQPASPQVCHTPGAPTTATVVATRKHLPGLVLRCCSTPAPIPPRPASVKMQSAGRERARCR